MVGLWFYGGGAVFWVLLRPLFLQLYLQWLGQRRLSEQMIWHYFSGAGGAAWLRVLLRRYRHKRLWLVLM